MGVSWPMKYLPWIALMLVATPAAADPKAKAVGFYRLATVTAEGKKIDLVEEFRKSLKNEGAGKFELDLMRMTIEIESDKLVLGVDQVMGERGSASYCSVQTTAGITLKNGKFTIPSLAAVGSAGVVTVKSATTTTKDETKTDTNTKKKTTKCNVSLDGGTYTIKGSGKAIELAYTGSDGKPVTLQLVADTRDVDLQARAAAFAGRK